MNIKATRKKVTDDFRINFPFVFFTQKKLCQWNAKEDFNQNDSLSIS